MAFQLVASGVGKKYYHRWIFRGLDCHLSSGDRMALTGVNGSGKSTLLHLFAGIETPTEGKIQYLPTTTTPISIDQWYQHLSWTGPSVALFEDFTLTEQLAIHFRFKESLVPDLHEMIDLLNLQAHKDKKLRYYSSGMLQRVKVGMALFTRSNLLLLDEPTSFMDEANATYALQLIERFRKDRIYILASNAPREFEDFEKVIRL